jgi:hypothetical protein
LTTCFSPKQFSCLYDVKSNVHKKRLLKRRRWNSVVSTQCECKVSFSAYYAHSAVSRRLLPDDVNHPKHDTTLRKQRGQQKPLIVHDVQEKSWKQNNTEPEMAKVKKNLHKSIQVWHQRTKGLARQQLDIENYSSLMEKKNNHELLKSVLQNSIDLCHTEIALRSWFSLFFWSQTEKAHKNEYTSSYLRRKQKKKGGGESAETQSKPNTRALPRPPQTEAHKEHQQRRNNNNNSPGGGGGGEQRKQTNGNIQDPLLKQKLTKNCQQ